MYILQHFYLRWKFRKEDNKYFYMFLDMSYNHGKLLHYASWKNKLALIMLYISTNIMSDV
jgi:hypothetical protein